MGYRVQSYELSELRRISNPGAVVPSLFWLLPLGNWDPRALDQLWRWFTEPNESVCHGLGLMLAKESSTHSSNDIDLSGAAASIESLLPGGHLHRVPRWVSDLHGSSTLFVAGAYPQPGWGLMIRFSQDRLPGECEDFATEILKRLNCKYQDDIQSLREAVQLFHIRSADTNRVVISKGYQMQWRLASELLVAAEAVCRECELAYQTIAWDYPRMVGWKLASSGLSITVEDLHFRTRELLGPNGLEAPSSRAEYIATGTDFTDYIHYIVSLVPHRAARLVTCKLLERLLRFNEIQTAYRQFGAIPPNGASTAQLIDELLSGLGWPNPMVAHPRPLAAWVRSGSPRASSSAESANSLRISLESFSKDLLDIVTSELNVDEDQIWQLIMDRIPTFRRSGTWESQVSNITLGPAAMLLGVLLKVAFPNQVDLAKKIVQCIEQLAPSLNRQSHHNETRIPAQEELQHCLNVAKNLLELADELLGEMPWHFNVQQSTGGHPQVLTGNGWSHSHAVEKPIRVLAWEGSAAQDFSTIWNPSRVNPVIVDPRIIRRKPRTSQ